MRTLSMVAAVGLLASGCVSDSYQISHAELARLAQVPPAQRGQAVRVDQEIQPEDVAPAESVGPSTEVIFVAPIQIHVGDARPHGSWGAGTATGGAASALKHHGASDAKGDAIAALATAIAIVFVAAAVEGQRFDGLVQLHPMHPLHLIGPDDSDLVVPLAWLDPNLAAWADHAVVLPSQGPWREVARAHLERGLTYGVYLGEGAFTSADGGKNVGLGSTIQVGYFPQQQIGVLASAFFGWRDNAEHANLFEARYTGELQVLPLDAGAFHAGLYGGVGLAQRIEDGVAGGDATGLALTGGAMFQLELHTRVALTARLGAARAHGETMQDVLVGLSVY